MLLALREPLRPLPEAGPLGVGMVLWIACDDANALHDLIVKRGGAILSPLADGPLGRFFVAGDPDGYTTITSQCVVLENPSDVG